MSYRYRFILPVWGEKFVERFAGFGLPSQLAPENLPALPADRCAYHIFTTSRDARRLRDVPSFQQLQQLVPTTLELIDDVYLGHAYAAMTECHNRGLAKGRDEDCAFVFATPDTLWADGSFREMHRLAETGQRAILVAGPRINAETALASVEQWPRRNGAICLSTRELVVLIVRHLHPASRAYLCAAGANRGPGYFLFAVGNEGLLIRAAHLHPLLVRPERRETNLSTNLDGDFVHRSCPDLDRVHVVADSDAICVAEFSDGDYLDGCYSSEPLSLHDHVTFLQRNTDEHHRAYLRYKIRLHADEITPSWDAAELESDAVVERLLQAFADGQAQPNAASPKSRTPGHDVAGCGRRSALARALLAIGQVSFDPIFGRMGVRSIDPRHVRLEESHCYVVDLTDLGIFAPSDKEFHAAGPGQAVSRLTLFEDGQPLGPPHQQHAIVRNKGNGRYSHWGQGLHFSTSDNSDPRTNGRTYSLEVPRSLSCWLRRTWWRASRRLRVG